MFPLTAKSGTSHHSLNNLPALPFELQLSILSQIPPNQLFFLRRVSNAWNNMLRNEHLLEAINATIPFLTSAPNLTSRMKRRMRMARGEPVWVQPFDHVFPWAADLLMSEEDDGDDREWKRFSDGWLVYLTASEIDTEGDSFAFKPCITLAFGGLHTQDMVEVDVLAVMKQVNPDLHGEWYGQASGVWRRGRTRVERFHFIVQEGKAVVGLKATKTNPERTSQFTTIMRELVLGTYAFPSSSD